MKSLKNDILSIMPIYPSVENDNQVIEPNKGYSARNDGGELLTKRK